MASGRLILRVSVGALMAGHGLQKLKGSFGGPGLQGTEDMMRGIGMHPAKHQARAAALSETVGGGLTALGLWSPLGPAMITGTMLTAIKKVHAKNGLWAANGGFEYNLTLIAAAFALAAEGPGKLSVDGLLGNHRSGLRWGLFELGLAFGVTAANLELAKRMTPRATPPEATTAGPTGSGTQAGAGNGEPAGDSGSASS